MSREIIAIIKYLLIKDDFDDTFTQITGKTKSQHLLSCIKKMEQTKQEYKELLAGSPEYMEELKHGGR
jgi:hypothetical protein